MRNAYKNFVGNHLGDLGKKQSVRMWIGFIWLCIGTSGRLL
jgi:hypothetical protein